MYTVPKVADGDYDYLNFQENKGDFKDGKQVWTPMGKVVPNHYDKGPEVPARTSQMSNGFQPGSLKNVDVASVDGQKSVPTGQEYDYAYGVYPDRRVGSGTEEVERRNGESVYLDLVADEVPCTKEE